MEDEHLESHVIQQLAYLNYCRNYYMVNFCAREKKELTDQFRAA